MIAVVALSLLLSVAIGADWTDDAIDLNEIVPLSVKSRIHGGIIANLGIFPYMVPMFISKPNGESFCGGSLISDEFVLTAAHCLAEATEVKVYLGARSIAVESDPNRIEFMVGKEGLIVHENYDGPAYLHDIALLRLPQKIQFTDEIQAVRLARRSQQNFDNMGTVITGWGKTGNNADRSDLLRYAQRRILPNEICSKVYGKVYHPSNICIDGAGQSPCPGDSGGAAIIVDREDKHFTQIGVTSYVHSSGCENGFPVSYTKVSSYLDWIHKHTDIPIRE